MQCKVFGGLQASFRTGAIASVADTKLLAVEWSEVVPQFAHDVKGVLLACSLLRRW